MMIRASESPDVCERSGGRTFEPHHAAADGCAYQGRTTREWLSYLLGGEAD